MSGGSLTFDELRAVVRASCGDDLRAAGEGWARAAELLDSQADTLAAGLPALEWAWGSVAGHVHADGVRALVARIRATADVARHNHAQMLAAADITDDAVRQLALVSESADREAVARDVADALNETYANVAARLAEPLDLGSPLAAERSGPQVLFPGAASRMSLSSSASAAAPASASASAPASAAAPASASASASAPASASALASAAPDGQVRASAGEAPEDATPGDDADVTDVDVDPDLPDAVEPVPLPDGRPYRSRAGGQGQRFPTTPRPAVAPVLPAPLVSPVPRVSGSGPPAAVSGAAPVVSQPRARGKRAVEETYVDARGHRVRIRWRSTEAVVSDP